MKKKTTERSPDPDSLLTSEQLENHCIKWVWKLPDWIQRWEGVWEVKLFDHSPSSSDTQIYWRLNPEFKGSINSTKSYSCLSLIFWQLFVFRVLPSVLVARLDVGVVLDAVACWWILYRAQLPLRGVNEEDSQSHSLVFLENPPQSHLILTLCLA